MYEQTIQTINVPDKLCEKSGISFSVVNNNDISVFPFRKQSLEDTGKSSEFAPCEGSVYLLKANSIMDDPELRKLINESHAIFVSSRSVPADENSKHRVLEQSREHRSSIRQCIENMHQAMCSKSADYENWIKILESIELIWHLCELLHLEAVHSDIVLPKLIEWSRLNSVEYDENISKELHMGKGAEIRIGEKYWVQIMSLLVESRFEATRALLRLHSEADSKSFMEADAILRGIPIYTIYCGLSPVEFNGRWRAWKSMVRSKISAGTFSAYPHLLNVMNILGGVEPLFPLLKPHCHTWYQMLTAILQFTDPMVKVHDLNYYAQQCIDQYGGPSKLRLLDHSILALFDADLATVIKKLQLTADNGWSAVHLTNLLYLSGCLNKSPETTVDLEPMLLEYGQLLMSHKRFWQIGLMYLKYCPTHGKESIAIQLCSLPVDNTKISFKVIEAARSNGLHDVVKSICRVLAMKHIKEGNYGNALTWALNSKDSEVMTQIADKYLYKYSTGSSDKELNCHNILTGLGQSVFSSGRLTFLCKYCDFQRCYQQGKVHEAASILIKLLESRISPKYFWFTLLLDSLPLLEMKIGTPVFSHEDSNILLATLEELAIGWVDNPVRKTHNFNDQIKIIRLAITKNLARTLLLQSNAPTNSNTIICY